MVVGLEDSGHGGVMREESRVGKVVVIIGSMLLWEM